eukprot:m.216805 g.216805  ORF g.216805 m.216805 type:complete len:52 (+) comp16984_c1_seq45:1894-2049(+)
MSEHCFAKQHLHRDSILFVRYDVCDRHALSMLLSDDDTDEGVDAQSPVDVP